MKRLYRSKNDRMLCGVCGGIGEYLDIDPTLIRLLWALAACSHHRAGGVCDRGGHYSGGEVRRAGIKW